MSIIHQVVIACDVCLKEHKQYHTQDEQETIKCALNQGWGVVTYRREVDVEQDKSVFYYLCPEHTNQVNDFISKLIFGQEDK